MCLTTVNERKSRLRASMDAQAEHADDGAVIDSEHGPFRLKQLRWPGGEQLKSSPEDRAAVRRRSLERKVMADGSALPDMPFIAVGKPPAGIDGADDVAQHVTEQVRAIISAAPASLLLTPDAAATVWKSFCRAWLNHMGAYVAARTAEAHKFVQTREEELIAEVDLALELHASRLQVRTEGVYSFFFRLVRDE